MRALAFSILFISAAGAQAPRTAPVPSYKDLKYPPLRQVQIPEVSTFTLPNGMRLYLLENHELPLVRGFALVRTGNLLDPPDKIGLAGMTGTVMRTGGTRDKTGDQIDEQLENIAASAESSIGETFGQVSFSSLKENTDEVMGVFKSLLTAPEFRQDKIDLAKTQLSSGISRRNDEPHGIASREFTNRVYGPDTPYGWEMEYEHVSRIQREDLLGFYKRYFFPANLMLAVYGDFTISEMKGKLEKLFADWTYTQPAVPAFPEVRRKPAPGVYLATKPEVTQTFFELGHLGGVFRDKDYPALEVMADILGGGFQSRLFQRIRTNLGYAYSISSSWGANYDHPGLFQVSGSTKSRSTTETVKAVQEEIEKIRAVEVSSNELETAKQSVLNSFVFNFDTRAKTLNRLLFYEYFGYPKDYIFQYQKAISSVTKADILRVAQKYLKPEEMTIVAVGNPKAFGEALTALGKPVNAIDLTIREPKQEAAKADAASIEKGKELLRRTQKAAGGAEKIAGVKDVVQVAEIQIAPQAGALKAKQTNRSLASGQFRQEVDLPFGKLTSYSDGKTGWMVSPQGSGDMPELQLKQAQGEIFRSYPRLLLSDQVQGRTVNYLGNGVLEISDTDKNMVKLTIDESTALPVKLTYQGVQTGGAPAEVEESFEQMKEVDGIQFPYKITILQGGKKFADVTVQDIKINTGLKAEELSKRP